MPAKYYKNPFALITSDLAGVFWQLSRMASWLISVTRQREVEVFRLWPAAYAQHERQE